MLRGMRSPAHEVVREGDVLRVAVQLPEVAKASAVDLNISASRLHLVHAESSTELIAPSLQPITP